MSSFTVPVSIIPCPGCCVPTFTISYVSATGAVAYEGYIDPRYMIAGTEGGAKTTNSTTPNYNAGTTYSTIHRTFSGGKFYQSLQNANVGNNPATSPAFWSECEAPVHWLSQTLQGNFTWFAFTFSGAAAQACTFTLVTLPFLVFTNTPPSPGVFCYRRDFLFSGGGSVDHTTGVETFTGATAINDHPANGPGSQCNIGPAITPHTAQAQVLGDFVTRSSSVVSINAGLHRDSSDASSTIFLNDANSCLGSVGGGWLQYVVTTMCERLFTGKESASTYLTPSGVLSTTLSGTWGGPWSQTGARSVLATYAMTGGAPTTAYTLTVTYSASGGATPPTEVYHFTTDGAGNATVIVDMPFGSAGQTVSIASSVVT